MRSVWVIVLSTCLGCGDSAAPAGARESNASMNSAGGSATADSGTVELQALVTKSVAAYDSALRAACECAAGAGGVTSVEECMAPSASGPSWIPCGTMALAANDSPEVRAIARCFADQLEARSSCLASTSCDSPDRAQCDSITSLSCVGSDVQLIVRLIEACPDLGLLSRLSPL